jgi:adenine-specific DNA-methyltransferase
MSNNEAYDRLKSILKELFQLDQADLDFGIYRIMNQKRDEITDFLDNRLITQVESTLTAHAGQNKEQLEKEVTTLEETLRSAGVDPDTNDKVKALRQQLYTADTTELQNTTFSHLTNFFKRYYSEGDFISQRRYKDDVYAIPYQGEEVKLHWANHDQYYIKTSEYFKNYRFNLRNGKTINFELVEASTEQNNNKSQNEERRFKLNKEEPFKETEKELTIHFTYEPLSKKTKQDKLMKEAFGTLKDALPNAWLTELLQPKPTEKDKKRTLLEKHLKEYTARNTFDYFIHKDLGGFLKRELDFYIKNEILHIDDIDLDKEESYRQSLQVIKAFKKVALKIIEFLTQLEEFQKKLWLKKKFVLQSDYCITLDRVDEAFYADIADNEEQRKEWITLYSIDELDDYSEPLTVDFLKANPFLMIDTLFYPREWKYKLLATIDQLDDQTNGLMFNSENFQVIEFIKNKYKRKLDNIYIDPPYNAKSSEILYKNTFKHSSWISLIENRLSASLELLKDRFTYIIAIDEIENLNLGQLINSTLTDVEDSIISIVHNPTGQQGNNFSYTHEFAHFIFPANGNYIGLEDRDDPKREAKPDIRPLRNVSSGYAHLRESAATCFYPIYIKDGEIVEFGDVCQDDFHPDSINEEGKNGVIKVYPIDPSGVESKWVFARDTVESIFDELSAEYDSKKDQWDIIRKKTRFRYKSLWSDKRYSANSWGSAVLNKIMPDSPFKYPKSIYTVSDCIDAGLNNAKQGIVFDYFAGSATTAHSVINLNRSDQGNRIYILAEMGEYFDSVTKPRVQKVVYSKEWKSGKPIDKDGISHCFKYLRLESYEDALNNLSLTRSDHQQKLLSDSDLSEEYMLRYMLEVESRDSLLNTEMFQRPFGYTIQATEHNERVETEVDLVETFNYLIGLTVESIQLIRGYVVVVGHNNDGERILVIWRDVEKHSNEALEAFCDTMEFNPHDNEFDLIYVNGDNNLQNLRKDEETWKVRLIEEAFHTLMFEKEGL